MNQQCEPQRKPCCLETFKPFNNSNLKFQSAFVEETADERTEIGFRNHTFFQRLSSNRLGGTMGMIESD